MSQYGQPQYTAVPDFQSRGGLGLAPQESGRTQYVSFAGAQHSYSHEETKAFSGYLNQLLANDPMLSDVLPLNPNDDSLFKAVSQGLLLWYVSLPPVICNSAFFPPPHINHITNI